jgi:hypothetical protein
MAMCSHPGGRDQPHNGSTPMAHERGKKVMGKCNGFPPEDELLLLLARGQLGTEVEDRARSLLEQGLSWSGILRRAYEQDVFPLLYRNLRHLGFPAVPREVQTDLEAAYRINTFRNTLLAEELVRVLTLLQGAGIHVIPLKGVALAESLYGDLTLRFCVDIDVLVPRQMVAQSLRLLLASGYRAEFEGATERFFADLFLKKDIEYALEREERGNSYRVELHWDILWGAPFDGDATENLWAEARPKPFGGVPAYALSPEWQLLFLSVHVSRHQWRGLKWLVDIHELCSQGGIDWPKLGAKARRLRWEDMLRITLSACRILFSTPIPEEFSLPQLPPWVKLFPAAPAPLWQSLLFPLRLLKRPSDKLRYLLRALFWPTLAERRLVRLPSSLGFLYYLLRPLRLGCKWGWRLICACLQQLRIART